MLGNDLAVQASRAEQVSPWPEGSTLAELVWKNTALEPSPGRWGFACWVGSDEEPYGSDASFAEEYFACHSAVKDDDCVFTRPVTLP